MGGETCEREEGAEKFDACVSLSLFQGIMIVVQNKTGVKWNKEREDIVGGKVDFVSLSLHWLQIFKACPPSIDTGIGVKFAIVMKNTKDFQFMQQWVCMTPPPFSFSCTHT